jgi:hypothetical protein
MDYANLNLEISLSMALYAVINIPESITAVRSMYCTNKPHCHHLFKNAILQVGLVVKD